MKLSTVSFIIVPCFGFFRGVLPATGDILEDHITATPAAGSASLGNLHYCSSPLMLRSRHDPERMTL
jgi:hypothetical protein